MRCPNCGNEISPGETFCGQCGTPNIPPAQPTEIVNSQFTHNEPLSSGYNPNIPSPSNAHNSGLLPPSSPSHTFYGGMPSAPTGPLYPNPPMIEPSGPQHQVGFYRDATEAMSSLPAKDSQNFQMGYLRQSQVFVSVPAPAGHQSANQYNPQMQPFQTSNYAGPATVYPQARPSLNGQSYRRQPQLPPRKKQSTTILIIVCICLAVAVITVAAFGAIYLLHNNSSKAHNKTVSRPTSAVTATVPAPSPTAASTPSPTPSPSPSPSPTPSVDQGFTLCGAECTSNGFAVEYPTGWIGAASQDPNGFGGEQFSNSSTNNPALMDEFVNFKSSLTTSNAPEALLAADFNVNFANNPGYTAPSSPSNAWIDGAKWSNEMASYQLNNHTEHVEVFAIVFQQRSYIIELQAPADLFDQINTQYFEFMLGRFQFQQSAP
jgi:hypothetical protein